MDLVEPNDGSGESDPLNANESPVNGRNSSGGGEGSSNPSSHSQSSSGLSIVHVAIPQAQVCKYIIYYGSVIIYIWRHFLLGAISDSTDIGYPEYT